MGEPDEFTHLIPNAEITPAGVRHLVACDRCQIRFPRSWEIVRMVRESLNEER